MQWRRGNSTRSAYLFVSINLVLLLAFLVVGSANLRNLQTTIAGYDSLVQSWFLFRTAALSESPALPSVTVNLPQYREFSNRFIEIARAEPIVAAATLSGELRNALERVMTGWRKLQARVTSGASLEESEAAIAEFQEDLLDAQSILRRFVGTQDRSMSLLLFCLGSTIVLIVVVFVAVEQENQRARGAAMRTRLLARTTLSAQESERARIARALHDSLAQELSLATIELSELEDLPSKATGQLRSRLDRAIEWVRDLAYELRPAEIDSLGLLAAVSNYCEDRSGESEATFTWNVAGTDSHIASHVAINVYRIAQESITNALRHSLATQVQLNLISEPERLDLSVVDNGVGFSMRGHPQHGRGLGITGMEERAEMIGASLAVNSGDRGGVVVTLSVPLQLPEKTAGGT